MEFNTRLGWVEVICGPMFAGKSEELIRRNKRLQYAKKNVVVFKPQIDNRYSEDEVVSHNKNKTKCYNLTDSQDVYKYVTDDTYAVCFDEVQFLNEDILTVINDLANKGKRVICAGLDNDFRGEPFSIMPKFLCMAEYVTKLTAICQVCGANATRTQRLVNKAQAFYEDPIIIIGASESYEPRCRHCHQVPHKK